MQCVLYCQKELYQKYHAWVFFVRPCIIEASMPMGIARMGTVASATNAIW